MLLSVILGQSMLSLILEVFSLMLLFYYYYFLQTQVHNFDLIHISIILSTGVWTCGPEITLT